MNVAMLSAFGLYLSIIAAIGLIAAFYNKNKSSQAVGHDQDRKVNWFVTAISAQAADMSGWLFMGLPAVIYLHGLVEIWVAVGLVLGMLATWQFLAAALRQATEEHRATTLPGYFENKYQETSGRISAVSAAIMAFFFTLYIAAGIKAVGYILGTTFGLSPFWGGLLTICVTLLYTLIGGFVAAAWVDFFQGIFLLCAIVMTTVVGYFSVGGASAIYLAAAEKSISFSLLGECSSFLTILLGPIAWGLGYFGMPHILAKFMGARDVKKMYKSKYIGISWLIIALGAAILCGLVAIPFFQLPLINPEKTLFISMSTQLFPAFFAGLILCGILSATLSTINAQMIVFASIVAEDLYKKLYHPRATSVQVNRVFQLVVLIAALIGFFIAWLDLASIFNMVEFAWGGLGASFGPLTLLSLYYKNINRHGAFFGIIAGCAASIAWKISGASFIGYQVNDVLPGFVIGLATIVIVSAFTRHRK